MITVTDTALPRVNPDYAQFVAASARLLLSAKERPLRNVTISRRLPRSGEIITKTVSVDDTPRPRGVVWVNSHSVWLRRYVREYHGVGIHAPGEWTPRTSNYRITPSRLKLVQAFAKERP